jgi:hypothetical protein
VFLETLLRIRKGNTPLLPYDSFEHSKEMLVSTIDMAAAIDLVASRMRSVDRQKIKVDVESSLKELRAGKAWINLDKALRMVVDFWKALVYDTSTSRLEALFASADSDQNGELDFQEFIDIVDKVNSQGFSAMSGRSTLRMYSQMSLHEKVDANVFCNVGMGFGLAKIRVGSAKDSGASGKTSQERGAVFRLLKQHWQAVEKKVLHVVHSLRNTAQGNALHELALNLRLLLHEEEDPELAVLCFRCLVGDMPPSVQALIRQEQERAPAIPTKKKK